MKMSAILLMLALTGCATGNELSGSWSMTIAREGRCRVVAHTADTDQLETRTVWRGEGCPPKVEPAPAEPEN